MRNLNKFEINKQEIILLTDRLSQANRNLWQQRHAYKRRKPVKHKIDLPIVFRAKFLSMEIKLTDYLARMLGTGWIFNISYPLINRPHAVISGASNMFIQKINDLVEINLDNSCFGIIQLAKKMNLSLSQLFRKIKNHTGKSPAIYIRSIRLRKARELLLNTEFNIAEIAYKTGFNDPSYFTRCFLKEFGITPRKTRN